MYLQGVSITFPFLCSLPYFFSDAVHHVKKPVESKKKKIKKMQTHIWDSMGTYKALLSKVLNEMKD